MSNHDRDSNHIRAFVLRACLMSLMFEKIPGLKSLLEGLRYSVNIRTVPELGELPVAAITAPYPSSRPVDEVVLLASGLSGGNVFEEVLDLDAVRKTPDPVRNQIQTILEKHGEKL